MAETPPTIDNITDSQELIKNKPPSLLSLPQSCLIKNKPPQGLSKESTVSKNVQNPVYCSYSFCFQFERLLIINPVYYDLVNFPPISFIPGSQSIPDSRVNAFRNVLIKERIIK